jgi:hypothetical protein
MMNRQYHFKNWLTVILALTLLVSLVGCHSAWQGTVVSPDGSSFPVNKQVLEGLADLEEVDGGQGVPLEWVLLEAGHWSVERLIAVESGGARHEFEWAAVADRAWWLDDGRIWVDGQTLPVSHLEVEPSAWLGQVQARITDIAPTAAAALGLPTPAQATGQVLKAYKASHVLILLLDGFGHLRYTEARRDGLIPRLAALGEPLVGLTTYPPATSVSTASLLTGAPPEVHGANQRGIRKTEVETLFDVATAAGLRVTAVEGESLAFNLRNAEAQLSGDRDGNGGTDDNVLANALTVLEGGMPDLFFVHFHGIDDAGHTYGPGALEECAKISEVDAAVGQLIEALPSDTLILILADHGMHRVSEEGQLGNHGHLIERDMFIPIFVIVK